METLRKYLSAFFDFIFGYDQPDEESQEEKVRTWGEILLALLAFIFLMVITYFAVK